MNIRSLAVILFRLIALYLFYRAAINTTQVFNQINYGESQPHLPVFALFSFMVLLPSLFGLILWLFPNTLARIIIKPAQNEPVKVMGLLGLMRLVVLSLGLYLTVWAFFDVIYWSVFLLSYPKDYLDTYLAEQQAMIFTTGAEFIVGLILVAKNTWIAQFLLNVNKPNDISNDRSDNKPADSNTHQAD